MAIIRELLIKFYQVLAISFAETRKYIKMFKCTINCSNSLIFCENTGPFVKKKHLYILPINKNIS